MATLQLALQKLHALSTFNTCKTKFFLSALDDASSPVTTSASKSVEPLPSTSNLTEQTQLLASSASHSGNTFCVDQI
jgi:hypothetical protein